MFSMTKDRGLREVQTPFFRSRTQGFVTISALRVRQLVIC